MCLSTVYYDSDAEQTTPLAKNVTAVSVANNVVILSDLLGGQQEIPGIVERIDLIKNYIIIKAPEAA